MRTSMQTWLSRLAALAGLGLVTVSAQAGNGVYWAVNVDAPVQGMGRVSTAVSNTRGGVYAQPGVVVYAPPPPVVVYPQRPPMVAMPGYGYGVAPVVYEEPRTRLYRGDRDERWDRDDRHRHHHHEHRHGWRDGRDDDRRGWRER